MKKLMTATLGASLALGLAACGGGSSPEDTVKEFAQAGADKDWTKVCAMLDPEFVKTAEASGESCEDSMKQTESSSSGGLTDPDKLEVGDAKVSDDGNTATVPTTYEGNKTDLKLVKVDGEWKITFDL